MALPPHSDPGEPDVRGPGRLLWWLVRKQPLRVLRGSLLSSLWLGGVVLEPFLIRGAIDDGLVAGDPVALAWWVAAIAVVALLSTLVGVARHRTMTFLRADAAYRTVQVVTRRVARLGAVLPRRVATGEVVTVGNTDIWHVAEGLSISGPGLGGLVGYAVVAGLVLWISPVLGLVVLLGVPAVVLIVGPLLRRLQRAEGVYRRQQGELTARAGDIVAGLRVLRGIGGEELFAGRYRHDSQQLRAEGYRVGGVVSWVRGLATGVPALFVALVTWLAARMAAQGTITVGDLVAIAAYAAVLAVPVTFLIDGGRRLVRGLVAARRVVNLLRVRPELTDAPQLRPVPAGPADLHDPDSGLTVHAGELLALADRLGRYCDTRVTYGGAPLAELPLAQVRARILIGQGDAHLFPGMLRDLLRPVHEVDRATIERCLQAAAAEDIVSGLPEGLDTPLGTEARELSGGQRQRVRLARALLADPEVLVLLEPTSAVDAHTEAAIAQRLAQLRAGRTTVVVTTSPLLLDHAQRVALLAGDRVVATGSHAELLATSPDYRALVVRDATAPVPAAGPGR